jgi:hypothetical protein
MTADEFVEVVRKGSDKLRVDDIVLEARGQEYHGKGVLRIWSLFSRRGRK